MANYVYLFETDCSTPNAATQKMGEVAVAHGMIKAGAGWIFGLTSLASFISFEMNTMFTSWASR